MAYGVVSRSGCTERYGLVQIRLDLCLEAGDVRWNDPRFYVIDPTSTAYLKGYKGKVDELGSPLDPEAYEAWRASLSRVWLTKRHFHTHTIYLDPYTLRDEQIEAAIALHTPNFYKAWTDEWDKAPGGMRHGWDVATRRPRPTRFNLTQPELYVARKAECLSKLPILAASTFATRVVGEGQTFPSTDIDVGSAATDRGGSSSLVFSTSEYTQIDYNNAANATGAIDAVDIYLAQADSITTPTRFGTFTDNGSASFTCRDAESVGNITSTGLSQFTGLDIGVVTGDFIGVDNEGPGASGDIQTIDRATSGGSGVYSLSGAYCVATSTQTYSLGTGDILSLYGTGETDSAIVEVGDEAEGIGDEMVRRGRMVLMGSGVRGHP